MKHQSTMFRSAICFAVVFFFTISFTTAARADLDEGLEATCRITAPDGGRGTGCVFAVQDGLVYLLTAGHVVADAAEVTCEFWHDGHQSIPLKARVLARAGRVDAAVCVIEVNRFGGLLPKPIPPSPVGFTLQPGDTLLSAGCARGAWATAWKGHLVTQQGGELWFQPPPAGGRSGSAVLDASGKYIVGVLVGRLEEGDQAIGVAVSTDEIRRGLIGIRTSRSSLPPQGESHRVAVGDCPGGSCGDCSGGSCFSGIFGGGQPAPQTPLYPSMPLVVTPQGGQSIDISETNAKLDRIADLLLKMQPAGESPATATAPSDAEGKLQKLGAIAEQLIGDRETLLERIEQRIEKVRDDDSQSRLETVRAYVHDLAAEKLSDGTIGLTAGKLATAALGLSGPLSIAVAAGLWLVSRRIGAKIESGEPLLITRLIERIGDRIDDLHQRVSRQELTEAVKQKVDPPAGSTQG